MHKLFVVDVRFYCLQCRVQQSDVSFKTGFLWTYFTSNMGQLQHRCNRLRLLATCSIPITDKQNYNVIDYDYIASNHDYNRDYICLETSSERK